MRNERCKPEPLDKVRVQVLNSAQIPAKGGTTRFGKLPAATDFERQVKGEPNLNIIPRKGDALLFFPADENGAFDERTEHEGCPAVDEKFIARIWRHTDRVPPPFGLSDESIKSL